MGHLYGFRRAAMMRLYLRAALWLLFLAPFFFLTYNAANEWASRREGVGAIVFGWERAVPFLAWSIVPYWSSDVLYGLSLFLCRSPRELDTHGKRLLGIQILSVAFFILFPLRCTLERPAVDGVAGDLFRFLMAFDKPYNQAPSLHVSLAAILWVLYRRHLPGWALAAAGAWFVSMGVSAWTTYQHHFIDLPTGLWAGIFVVLWIREEPKGIGASPGFAAYYLGWTAVFAAAAFYWAGFAWLLLWPAFAGSVAAAAYWNGDAALLGKVNGRVPWWLAPYSLACWVNSRIWTWRAERRSHVTDGVWLSRAPGAAERKEFASIVDLTAELSLPSDANVPLLDMTLLSDAQLSEAAEAIEALRERRPTLVCCGLGYWRSAAAVIAWLVETGRAGSVDEAIRVVRAVRPGVRIRESMRQRLQQWAESRNDTAPRRRESGVGI